MRFIPCCLLMDATPGQPLIGNNFVFYSVFGGVLLLVLLFSLWLRRSRHQPVDSNEPKA